jgi:hypothetical protein
MHVHCRLFTTVERSLPYNEINHYLEVIRVLFYSCNTRKHNLSTMSCKITHADNFSYTFNENELLRSNRRQCLYLNNVIKHRKLTPLYILHYSLSISLNQNLGLLHQHAYWTCRVFKVGNTVQIKSQKSVDVSIYLVDQQMHTAEIRFIIHY